jgi:hypothetical protein
LPPLAPSNRWILHISFAQIATICILIYLSRQTICVTVHVCRTNSAFWFYATDVDLKGWVWWVRPSDCSQEVLLSSKLSGSFHSILAVLFSSSCHVSYYVWDCGVPLSCIAGFICWIKIVYLGGLVICSVGCYI